MSERVYNFSAGPAVLPEAVLQQAAAEMLNTQNSGQSVMEMSHRSPVYESIQAQAEQDLRNLLNIPQNYKVLFLQGGASLQFSMIPLNLLKPQDQADYIVTGEWAKKAAQEARKFGDIHVMASSEAQQFTQMPELKQAMIRQEAKYLYYVSNNTIYGTRMTQCPPLNHACVVCDMSSDILSREIDVSKHGLIFAGAQKNMGIAGLTVVIIREDLIQEVEANLPTLLGYKIHADAKSLYNTPPTYSIYIAGLVFKWILNLGGLKEMERLNQKKADLLYDALDASAFYQTTVRKEDRSWMNVTFKCPTEEHDKAFIQYCESQGLVNLKGYRSVGGVRASIYNAMPIEGVMKLVDCMKAYEQAHA